MGDGKVEIGAQLDSWGWIWATKIINPSSWLVVEPTHLKNMLVKLEHFVRVQGENKKYLSCHQLVTELGSFNHPPYHIGNQWEFRFRPKI